jgi:hypothetical protein
MEYYILVANIETGGHADGASTSPSRASQRPGSSEQGSPQVKEILQKPVKEQMYVCLVTAHPSLSPPPVKRRGDSFGCRTRHSLAKKQ